MELKEFKDKIKGKYTEQEIAKIFNSLNSLADILISHWIDKDIKKTDK